MVRDVVSGIRGNAVHRRVRSRFVVVSPSKAGGLARLPLLVDVVPRAG